MSSLQRAPLIVFFSCRRRSHLSIASQYDKFSGRPSRPTRRSSKSRSAFYFRHLARVAHLVFPLQNHSLALGPDGLISFGGVNDHGQVIADLSLYSLEQHRWARLSPAEPLPKGLERYSHVCGIHGSTLFVHGGINSAGQILDDLCLFNHVSQRWNTSPVTQGLPGPGRRYAHSATVVNGRLIIFGGSNGSRALADVWSLDMGTCVFFVGNFS